MRAHPLGVRESENMFWKFESKKRFQVFEHGLCSSLVLVSILIYIFIYVSISSYSVYTYLSIHYLFYTNIKISWTCVYSYVYLFNMFEHLEHVLRYRTPRGTINPRNGSWRFHSFASAYTACSRAREQVLDVRNEENPGVQT